MKRSAKAQWKGNLKQGQGYIDTESGVLSHQSYSFIKRFGDEKGTNPEELIAAAHASCFSMAFAAELEKRQLTAESIEVQAIVHLENISNSWSISEVNLHVKANVPSASAYKVEDAANIAKVNCPVSKLLRAQITLDLNLIGEAETGFEGSPS